MVRFYWLALVVLCALGSANTAAAQCKLERLEAFLEDRVFELSADEKIVLYAPNLVKYYDQSNVTRDVVFRQMRAWEDRWPERIYKFLAVTKYRRTEAGDACRVTYDYRFLAYSPERDKISAGIASTTLVLADSTGEGRYLIIGEIGTVRCRGLKKFARSRC